MMHVLLAALLVSVPAAKKPKAPKPAPAAPAPEPAAPAGPVMMGGVEVRAEVAAAVTKAETQVSDLDEDKALVVLDALAGRADLVPGELAAVQMWRGIALMGLSRQPDAEKAFSLSRACNPLLEVPGSASPKIRAVVQQAVPGDCPVKPAAVTADADEGLEFTLKSKPAEKPVDAKAEKTLYEGPSDAPAKPAPAKQSAPAAAGPGGETKGGGGPNVKAIAGGAVMGAGAVVAVVALLAAVGGAAALGASFPVSAWGNAQDKVVDYRRGLYAAFGMRAGSLAAFPAAAVLLLVGVVVLAGGGGLLAWGLVG